MKTFRSFTLVGALLIPLVLASCLFPAQVFRANTIERLTISPLDNPGLRVLHQAVIDEASSTITFGIPDYLDATRVKVHVSSLAMRLTLDGAELPPFVSEVDLSRDRLIRVDSFDDSHRQYRLHVSSVPSASVVKISEVRLAAVVVYRGTDSWSSYRGDLVQANLVKQPANWEGSTWSFMTASGQVDWSATLKDVTVTLVGEPFKVTVAGQDYNPVRQRWDESRQPEIVTVALGSLDLRSPINVILTAEDLSTSTVVLSVSAAP